ncbi:hypothetical protein [Pectobacterium brasiliense]|uniref:InvB/SpaK family type III secretion system chaperone n=1 Tax=Pectobacterium brasiliense TaxID=180957 RepID=UPI001968BF32|nr:hypothetical protein [Pectobacterium brasiliense]MBN3264705.1 hypothetical protein [Pectobacterium brasiliense]
MKHDVVALISEMLSNAGIIDVLDEGLNNHSTISLNMKDDIPTIHIKSEDDEVWVWAKLCDYNISSLSYYSASLFPVMLDYNENIFYAGQPCLYPIDGNLELRAQVKEPSLSSSDAFMDMLNHYLSIMQDYRRVLV